MGISLPITARLSRTVWAMPLRGLAPTTAIERGANNARRSMAGRGAPAGADAEAGWPTGRDVARMSATVLADDAIDAALLERPRDDQPLDLRGAFPDTIDAELAEEPLGRV